MKRRLNSVFTMDGVSTIAGTTKTFTSPVFQVCRARCSINSDMASRLFGYEPVYHCDI